MHLGLATTFTNTAFIYIIKIEMVIIMIKNTPQSSIRTGEVVKRIFDETSIM